jgi:hypothetical protein
LALAKVEPTYWTADNAAAYLAAIKEHRKGVKK